MRAWIAASLIALGGCESLDPTPTHLSGTWGGPNAGLLLEGGIGTVQYDCATGTIDSAIFPAPGGRFRASGTHRTGQGGPIRAGQIFISQRATYTGTVTADQMTLSVMLEDGTALGPFTLTKGAPPQLTRCL